MRIGAKKRPFYRIVVVDERNKRDGAYIENVGTYDPMTTPHAVNLKQDRIDDWVKKGAQLSDGFLRVIGKAQQRPPRKPKKEKAAPKEALAPAAAEPTDTVVGETEATTEAPVTEETPAAEEVAPETEVTKPESTETPEPTEETK